MKTFLTTGLLIIIPCLVIGQSSFKTFEEYNQACFKLDLLSKRHNEVYWEMGLKIENVKDLDSETAKPVVEALHNPYPGLLFNYMVSRSIFQIKVVSRSLEKIEGKMTFVTYKCRVIYRNTNGIPELDNQKYIYLCVDKGYNTQGLYFRSAHTCTLSIGRRYFVNVKKRKYRNDYFISNSVQIINGRVKMGTTLYKTRMARKTISDLANLF